MNQAIEAFNSKLSEIVHLLENQEQLDLVSGESAAQQRDANEEKLVVLLFELRRFAVEKKIYSRMKGIVLALEERMQRLRGGPRFVTIKEAQSILKYPNLTILAVEQKPMKGLELPTIDRLVALNNTGVVLIDHSFASSDAKLGSSLQEDIVQFWPKVVSITSGHYTLCEDIFQLQMQLMDTARQFGLELPVVIGQSFLGLYQRYFGLIPSESSFQRLDQQPAYDIPTLCEVLGISLPLFPHSTVRRAIGMLRLTEAMAQGEAGKPTVSDADHDDHSL